MNVFKTYYFRLCSTTLKKNLRINFVLLVLDLFQDLTVCPLLPKYLVLVHLGSTFTFRNSVLPFFYAPCSAGIILKSCFPVFPFFLFFSITEVSKMVRTRVGNVDEERVKGWILKKKKKRKLVSRIYTVEHEDLRIPMPKQIIYRVIFLEKVPKRWRVTNTQLENRNGEKSCSG